MTAKQKYDAGLGLPAWRKLYVDIQKLKAHLTELQLLLYSPHAFKDTGETQTTPK